MTVCAGIVTYNPDLEVLCKNIGAIYNQVDKVFIVDNASKNINQAIKKFQNWEKIEFVVNRKNLGVAAALNQLCSKAVESNFDWILTLDQDSVCPENLVPILEENIASDVAIIAPNIRYRNNEAFTKYKNDLEYVEWVITSASLTNLQVWSEVQFDEVLFIDGVDRDFCIRAGRLGYKIIKNNKVELLHELGNLKCRKIFGKVIYVTNHSKERKYYMVRNVIYLDRKLGQHIKYIYITKNILKTIIYEDDKLRKLIAMVKGISDGKRIKKF